MHVNIYYSCVRILINLKNCNGDNKKRQMLNKRFFLITVPGQNLERCCTLGREPSKLGHNCYVLVLSLDPKSYLPPCKARFFNCCVETHGTKGLSLLNFVV